jgi:hypothetical protein
MSTCQLLLKLHISKCMKGQLYVAVQNYSKKEVNSLLAETNFNIHENIILPKCSPLVVLRYTHEEKKQDWTTKNGPQKKKQP